jgi:DNA polymerase V
MFALIDCNNFYASCERLFRPDLIGKPILVLSSGDGCVIARSNEAKALGIPMGEPFFKIKSFCLQHKVQVFSSNFTLYRDMSNRVMSIILDAWEDTEIYSVDEAFLDLSTMSAELHDKFCQDLQKHILKCTGIPVSIGLGKSKTLAKAANHVAKKILKTPVFNIFTHPELLKKIAIGDVWGVGRQWNKKLTDQGIRTAYDLAALNADQLKRQRNIMMSATAMELQGISCLDIRHVDESKKSILSSRSFHKTQTTFDSLAESISLHCANVYEKLREQKSLTYSISVFLRTNRFRQDLPQYTPFVSTRLVTPTDDIRIITQQAKKCLREIYKPGFHYKKAGVYLSDFTVNDQYQLDLFEEECEKTVQSKKALLAVLDKINYRFGKYTMHLASVGFEKSWDTQFQHKSPAYTTRWSELPRIRNET